MKKYIILGLIALVMVSGGIVVAANSKDADTKSKYTEEYMKKMPIQEAREFFANMLQCKADRFDYIGYNVIGKDKKGNCNFILEGDSDYGYQAEYDLKCNAPMPVVVGLVSSMFNVIDDIADESPKLAGHLGELLEVAYVTNDYCAEVPKKSKKK